MTLASLLADLRPAKAAWGRLSFGQGGGGRLSGRKNCYLHIVTAGSLTLALPGSARGVDLREGQAVFLIGAKFHDLGERRDVPLRHIDYFDIAGPRDHIAQIVIGEPGDTPLGHTLSGAFSLDRLTLARIRPLASGAMGPEGILLFPETLGRADSRRWSEAATGFGATEYLGRLADLLLFQALREQLPRESRPSVGRARSRDVAPRLLAVIALMHRLPGEPWTLQSLAESVGMSRSTLAAAFSQEMGEPPMQFLTRIRMERAGELLKDTNLPIAQICTSVGFRSITSFSRLFKRWHDSAPGAYRGENRKPRAAGGKWAFDHWSAFS